jgi:hypothetical protein
MKYTFEQFMAKCDALCVKMFGAGVEDMGDAMWRDYYDDDMSPLDALETAFEDYWSGDMSDGVWDYFNHEFNQARGA